MTVITKRFNYGDQEIILETGVIAKQANGAVVVCMGDTVVLATACGKQENNVERDFFPLTVNYQERTYAVGKIPGGFFRREGRPSEKETLVSRLIDRPLRPLFPEGFNDEVQVIVTVLSMDPEIDSDIPSMIAASAALAVSGIPFNEPIGAARVGYINEQLVLNPKASELRKSRLNLVVAGSQDAVLMVESEADVLPEATMLEAVMFGHEKMQVVIDAIKSLARECGKARWLWQAPAKNTALIEQVKQLGYSELQAAYAIREKLARQTAISAVTEKVVTALCVEASETAPQADQVKNIIHEMERNIVRGQILENKPRIDGRDTKTVRPITVETNVLPRTHGSALFTRGETQALVTVTLGSERDAQIIDDLMGEYKDNFMLHYNFPPYCVGEVGFIGSPKRREIGHGRLAKRSVVAVVPNAETFPYTIRVVSEITESNGSSSMASVCGTSLALMDAGVPIKAPVAGIAMGLIKEGEKFAVLTDILGDEDHLGDMDFKVAGTKEGVTALQMDIKIQGINKEIMQQALSQAREGRLHILSIMNASLDKPREALSDYAPRITSFKIHPDKIRDVIGKGGATIREITESTGVTIDIDDNGLVKIAAVGGEAARKAKEWIDLIVAEVEVGQTYDGIVQKIMDFGAFVNFLNGKSGLVHVSQIADERVENVADRLSEGQKVRVKVLEIDRQGRIRLSMKAADVVESV